MSGTRKLTRQELEYYATAKPGTRESAGYFDGDNFKRGPYYSAKLGKKIVGFVHGSYVKEAGMYLLRADALEGAKLFQSKCKELLGTGDYAD